MGYIAPTMKDVLFLFSAELKLKSGNQRLFSVKVWCLVMYLRFCTFTSPTSLLELSGASGSWGKRQFSHTRVSKHLGWICQSSGGIQEAASTSGEALWYIAEATFILISVGLLTLISISLYLFFLQEWSLTSSLINSSSKARMWKQRCHLCWRFWITMI